MNEEEKSDGHKLIQQLRVEGDAKHTVIIQQQNITSSMILRGKAGKERRRMHVMEKMLWDLMAALPDPKLKSLENFVVAVAVESFASQKNAAGYLGISQMKVSSIMRSGAAEIKPIVSKYLWKPKAVVPAIACASIEAGELVAEIPEEVDRLAELVKAGRVIVREINRNEL